MTIRKPPLEYSIKDLERELIARGAQVPEKKRFKFGDKTGTPQRDTVMREVKEFYDKNSGLEPDEGLRHIETWDLVKILIYKTRKLSPGGVKGIWDSDDRMDVYEIQDEKIKGIAGCVATVCKSEALVTPGNGFTMLKTKNYGKAFDLCDFEPFRDQPVARLLICTGFLVKEDVVATAAHFADQENVKSLRFMFGYRMEDPYTPVTQVPDRDIYTGVEIVERVYDPEGADWALVRLDRKVEDRPVAQLAENGIAEGQKVYVMGHPCGLPLKYSPGSVVGQIKDAHFHAGLDIYSSNSGSPVLDSETHQVVGMVVRGHNADFLYTGRGYISVINTASDRDVRSAECTRVSEFRQYC